MSRIGRRTIIIPDGVKVAEQEGMLSVAGPKGHLSLALSPHVGLKQGGSRLDVERSSDDRIARAHHGLMRKLISNMVAGVTQGFEKRLDINGVGFKAEVSGRTLTLNLGYSHPIVYAIPVGIEIAVDRQTKLIVKGIDAQLVGQVAAELRRYRRPDVYKVKGIRYEAEFIRTKAGKAGGKK